MFFSYSKSMYWFIHFSYIPHYLLYWNQTSTWVFSCKFASNFQNTFLQEHLWGAASKSCLDNENIAKWTKTMRLFFSNTRFLIRNHFFFAWASTFLTYARNWAEILLIFFLTFVSLFPLIFYLVRFNTNRRWYYYLKRNHFYMWIAFIAKK